MPGDQVDPKLVIEGRTLGELGKVDANLLSKLGKQGCTAKPGDRDARGDGPAACVMLLVGGGGDDDDA